MNRRPLRQLPLVLESVDEGMEAFDYVFRIVEKSNHEEYREFLSKFQLNALKTKINSVTSHPLLEFGRTSPRRSHLSSSSTNESSEGSSKSLSLDAATIPVVVIIVFYPLIKSQYFMFFFSLRLAK